MFRPEPPEPDMDYNHLSMTSAPHRPFYRPLVGVWYVPDNPLYVVDWEGNVYNARTERLITQRFDASMQKQVVTMYVGNPREKRRRTYNVARLVGEIFLPYREAELNTYTLIHLNGDYTDCRATNLAWRPRWFKRQYQPQITYEAHLTDLEPLYEVRRQLSFDSIYHACMTFGVIPNEVRRVLDEPRCGIELWPSRPKFVHDV